MADDQVHDAGSGSEADDSDNDVDPPAFHFGQRPVMRRCLSDADVSKILTALDGLEAMRTTMSSSVKNFVKTVPLEFSMLSARMFCGAIICATGHAAFVGKYFSTDLDLPTEMRRIAVVTRMYCEYAASVEEQRASFVSLLNLCKTEDGKMMVDIAAAMKPNQMNRASQAATALSTAARFAKVAPRQSGPQFDDELVAVPVAQKPDEPVSTRKRPRGAVSPPAPASSPQPPVEEGDGGI